MSPSSSSSSSLLPDSVITESVLTIVTIKKFYRIDSINHRINRMSFIPWIMLIMMMIIIVPTNSAASDCPVGSSMTFELITGHVFTSPTDMVTMIPGVLHLAECIEHCRQNQTCSSLNFETGLCVLLSSSALQRPQALTASQFPVFTIYAQKICLKGLTSTCIKQRGWAFERVRGYELREHDRRMTSAQSPIECMQACVYERKFQCRSVNYDESSGECWLSDMNRHTINVNTESRTQKYGPSGASIDYFEYNCLNEPNKLCDFKPIHGKILKTVDSVYQNVSNLEECQQMCLTGSYKCHSYDFGDPSNPVCRTSHLDKISLAHIENPYIEISGAATYELQACYDVNIQCQSREMVAKVRSSKIFDGKVYAKRKPYHCMTDVTESLEFEIHMAYNDLECDVQQPSRGQYTNDIVIQHHDMIVTTQDLGLNINCKYDLSNRSISNNVNLDISGNLQPIGTHSAVVDSPNVTMKIVDLNGANVRAAKVGDPLVLRFEILDNSSPYELFVRELVALDGTEMSEFTLIDSDGCPTDLTIMKPVARSESPDDNIESGHTLETHFEAFKFPTSDIVQFKALITPCVTDCEPIKCNINLPNGRTSQAYSYGRRRRRRRSPAAAAESSDAEQPTNVIVIESLSVTDKFSNDQTKRKKIEQDDHSAVYADFPGGADQDRSRTSRVEFGDRNSCVNLISLLIFVAAFLVCQIILMISWSLVWKKKQQVATADCLVHDEMIYDGPSYICNKSPSTISTTSSSAPFSNQSILNKVQNSKIHLYAIPSRHGGYHLS